MICRSDLTDCQSAASDPDFANALPTFLQQAASFVHPLAEHSVFNALAELPITGQATIAGVLSDCRVENDLQLCVAKAQGFLTRSSDRVNRTELVNMNAAADTEAFTAIREATRTSLSGTSNS